MIPRENYISNTFVDKIFCKSKCKLWRQFFKQNCFSCGKLCGLFLFIFLTENGNGRAGIFW